LLATIPLYRSRYFPFEKSKGFPAASVTTPPASVIAHYQTVKASSETSITNEIRKLMRMFGRSISVLLVSMFWREKGMK